MIYYQDQHITLHHGDCREIAPTLGRFDLLLTDPPYGIKWSGTGFKKQPLLDHEEAKTWDEKPDRDTLLMLKELAKHSIFWGGNYLCDVLGCFVCPLIWDKETGANPFADGEMAWTSFKSGTMRIYRHQWCGAFKDSERGVRNEHPTQKPIELMKWCIGLTPEPKTIFDPFAGSGTTGRAAKDLGLHCTMIEREERYCEIAAKRMAQEVLF